MSGTEPIDAAVADFAGSDAANRGYCLSSCQRDVHWCFAGAVIYMGELKDTVDVQIEARIEDD